MREKQLVANEGVDPISTVDIVPHIYLVGKATHRDCILHSARKREREKEREVKNIT